MAQEEKDLLLKGICARLPYGVKIHIDSEFLREKGWDIQTVVGIDFSLKIVLAEHNWYLPEKIKPYLRPMSSMTEEERKIVCTMNILSEAELDDRIKYQKMYVQNYTIETFDLFNSNHLDYLGLIEKGLAIESHEGVYDENC